MGMKERERADRTERRRRENQRDRHRRITDERRTDGYDGQIDGRTNRQEGDVTYRTPRTRKTEAIVIHKSEQVDTYAEILRRIKDNINIDELGIQDTRIRRTATGSLLIQITGENCKHQADTVADKMKAIVGYDAKMDRPCRRADRRIIGLDEDTTSEDIADAIVEKVQCDKNEIKVGQLRRNKVGIEDV